jgi:hypothetical protein
MSDSPLAPVSVQAQLRCMTGTVRSRRLPRVMKLAAFAALLTLTGCTRTGTVTGSVTLDGQPVLYGQVAFTGADGKAVSALISNGKFTLEKVPVGPGTFTVDTQSVQAMRNELTLMQGNDASGAPAPPSNATTEARMKELMEVDQKGLIVPASYNDPSKSGLKYTVKSGNQPFDLKLTSQGQ